MFAGRDASPSVHRDALALHDRKLHASRARLRLLLLLACLLLLLLAAAAALTLAGAIPPLSPRLLSDPGSLPGSAYNAAQHGEAALSTLHPTTTAATWNPTRNPTACPVGALGCACTNGRGCDRGLK